jgi:hypothetical protein
MCSASLLIASISCNHNFEVVHSVLTGFIAIAVTESVLNCSSISFCAHNQIAITRDIVDTHIIIHKVDKKVRSLFQYNDSKAILIISFNIFFIIKF